MTTDLPTDAPGIYLHVPFCRSICPYCDFAVRTGKQSERRRFVDVIEDEIRSSPPFAPADTIYLGGGTPSALDPDELGRLMEVVAERCVPNPTLHLEANPEDVTLEVATSWRALGVSFLSLGVQAFASDDLRFLGRRHDERRARGAIDAALEAGLATVSIDLMFGWPDHALTAWLRTLDVAAASGVHHVSGYQLTIHEGTPFARRRDEGRLAEAPEESRADLFFAAHERLGEAGLVGYEVSNFARAGHRSRHNQKYWRHTPYFGFGPSAHSFSEDRRWWNHRTLDAYERALAEQRTAVAGQEMLTRADLALEELLLRLRTREGVDGAAFRRRHDVDLLAQNAAVLDGWVVDGLIVREGAWIRPTLAGLAVADRLATELAIEGA